LDVRVARAGRRTDALCVLDPPDLGVLLESPTGVIFGVAAVRLRRRPGS